MTHAVTRTLNIPDRGTSLDVSDIGELLSHVNAVTQRLQQTHEQLRRQVADLQRELAEANEQLRRSRALAALGEMAAGIAHEIRNPLASIRLDAQVLSDELRDRPEQASCCRRIDRAVDRLDGIVRDVLSFSRDTRVRPRPLDADELLARAGECCRGLLAAHGARLDVAPCGGLSLVADAGLLEQALGNLIRNGVEAMAETPVERRRLRLEARRERPRTPDGRRAERIVLAVDDNGPGVTPDVMRRMFNPFFTTRAAGTGLGLAIVHRIVDAHGGEVAVSNRREGGARVELRLPPRPPVGGAGERRGAVREGTPGIEVDQQSLDAVIRRRINTERIS
ncbi:MAG: hypothetical protein HRU76_10780 [Phycisphaeraceae bacterium]|nr:hypothetical protein [Phycisphaerales bacterium]QOJ18040.1 MAG: hypothetical protein HRU76_10780 [Phycisphaeraceae bacterium]